MRRHHAMERRLWAGERASVDDATRNVPCWIAWPWGGCPCSDKFGVRLGRWQTLIVHDDATSFIPFVSSVFRWHQSYNGSDAASVILRAEQQVCQFDLWAIEGGVWQSKQPLAVLGGRFISAKGRPNQKLVENTIGRLWDIMAGQPGDVGRYRAEMKVASDLYNACRRGDKDPRKHFLPYQQGQEQLYAAVEYLGEKRIQSRTYGSWVPKERWEADLEEMPRTQRNAEDDFLVLPVHKSHVVRRGSIQTTQEGPMGVSMLWTFAAEWLWKYEGRRVVVHFDHMAAWPVMATVTLEGEKKPIGTVECVNTHGESKDRAVEMISSIRKTMMQETRVILTRHTERILRHNQGIIAVSSGAAASSEMRAPHSEIGSEETPAHFEQEFQGGFTRGEPLAVAPQDPRAASAPVTVTREDLSDSLSRRARLARAAKISI